MTEEIEIEIDEQGNIKTHIKGTKGKGCEKIEAELIGALGKLKKSDKTSEYYQTEQIRLVKK